MKKVLIIEDDNVVSLALKMQLEKYNFEVFQVYNGSAAMRKIINISPDCIILDIGLPDKNGYDICMEIRSFYEGAIVFYSSHEDPAIEIACFELGADDYVSKSTPFQVLYERMKRLGVRADEKKAVSKNELNFDDITFLPKLSDCSYNGTLVGLTQEEYELFYFMAINNEAPVSRQMILQVLKGTDYNGFDRSIDIKVARIRRKLKNVGYVKPAIYSIRSKGYQFAIENAYAC